MIFTRKTVEHEWFAWKPVPVLQRTGASVVVYWVWLATVNRQLVSNQGVLAWTYSFLRP